MRLKRKMRIVEKIFKFDRADTCPICRSDRSIEAYLRNGNPIHLSLAIDRGKDVSQLDIVYMKCKNCGREFFPAWLNGYPTPMVDTMIEHFMNSYRESYKKSETT